MRSICKNVFSRDVDALAVAASASVYLALLRNVEFFFENEINLWCVFARDAKVLSAVAPARVYAALLRKVILFLENEMDL